MNHTVICKTFFTALLGMALCAVLLVLACRTQAQAPFAATAIHVFVQNDAVMNKDKVIIRAALDRLEPSASEKGDATLRPYTSQGSSAFSLTLEKAVAAVKPGSTTIVLVNGIADGVSPNQREREQRHIASLADQIGNRPAGTRFIVVGVISRPECHYYLAMLTKRTHADELILLRSGRELTTSLRLLEQAVSPTPKRPRIPSEHGSASGAIYNEKASGRSEPILVGLVLLATGAVMVWFRRRARAARKPKTHTAPDAHAFPPRFGLQLSIASCPGDPLQEIVSDPGLGTDRVDPADPFGEILNGNHADNSITIRNTGRIGVEAPVIAKPAIYNFTSQEVRRGDGVRIGSALAAQVYLAGAGILPHHCTVSPTDTNGIALTVAAGAAIKANNEPITGLTKRVFQTSCLNLEIGGFAVDVEVTYDESE